MYGTSNSQAVASIAAGQHQHDLRSGMARVTMSPGGSWHGWARA
jgi:hypothetical protein